MTRMDSFAGKLAVVTGGGSGMGRELVRQLAAQGCSVAACDLHPDAVTETAALARADAGPGVRVTGHACDVSDEAQVLRFRDELLGGHATRSRGPGLHQRGHRRRAAASSTTPAEEWERTFAVDWWGVYHCARAFLPLLMASGDGVTGQHQQRQRFLGVAGPGHAATPPTAPPSSPCRGFSEALIEDLRSQRAPGPGGRGDAGSRGHRHRREHPPRPRPDGAGADERCPAEGADPGDAQAELVAAGCWPRTPPPGTCASC